MMMCGTTQERYNLKAEPPNPVGKHLDNTNLCDFVVFVFI